MFWIGAGAAYFAKLGSNKALRRDFFYRPWEFPVYMLCGGFVAVYYDWYRRLTLEAICQAEDLRDATLDLRHSMTEDPFLRANDS